MALICFDGFDAYRSETDLSLYITGTNLIGLLSDTGRYGYGAKTLWVRNRIARPIPPTNFVTVGFAHKRQRDPVNGAYDVLNMMFPNVNVDDPYTPQGPFIKFSDSGIIAGVGLTSSEYTTLAVADPYPRDTWQYVEVQIKIGITDGAVTVRVDGINQIALVGVNTQGSGASMIDRVRFTSSIVSGQSLIDDLYICDGSGPAPYNDFLGICSVRVRTPSANGDYHDFTPNTAGKQNWEMAFSNDGDTSYNTASAIGATDTFTSTSNMVPSGSVVLGLNVKAVVRKDDTADRSAQTILKSGDTESPGNPRLATQTYQTLEDLYTTDPATGSGWTAEAVNAVEFGYRIT